jgi:hypothetical protein
VSPGQEDQVAVKQASETIEPQIAETIETIKAPINTVVDTVRDAFSAAASEIASMMRDPKPAVAAVTSAAPTAIRRSVTPTAKEKKDMPARKSSSRTRASKSRRSSSRKYSKGASDKVGKTMHEMKRGKLKSGRSGKKVTSRKQAIAIGLSQARREGAKVPKKGRTKSSPSRSRSRGASRTRSRARKSR